jgi:hypothetical protein
MSDDLVNQLTLNFLISKNQLQKLNKRLKDTTETKRKSEREIYEDRIKTLFNDLLVDNPPTNLLQEVKTGFDFFLDKCIYYLKASDDNELLEKERTNINDDYSQDIIRDDIDYEKEERDIERGNYKEKSDDEDEEDEEDDEEDEEDEDEEEEEELVKELDKQLEADKKTVSSSRQFISQSDVIVQNKYKKSTNSIGVEDIQKLPLDWFQNVRQDYKKNKIIPRKKEIVIQDEIFRDQKKKI